MLSRWSIHTQGICRATGAKRTRAASRLAPISLFAGDETLQPQEGASRLSCEGQLQILGPCRAQGGTGNGSGASIQLHDGHDQGMQQISVKKPCLARLGVRGSMEVAEAVGGCR